MLARCYSRSHTSYADYGGRGIAVCAAWHSFVPFRDWAVAHGYADNLEIDRIDNNGIYEPANCRFVSHTTNLRNMSSNRMISFNGETLCLVEWSHRTGIKREAIASRLNRGWPTEKALTAPTRAMTKRNITVNGKTMSLCGWAAHAGLSVQLILWRLKHGWSDERAVTTLARVS